MLRTFKRNDFKLHTLINTLRQASIENVGYNHQRQTHSQKKKVSGSVINSRALPESKHADKAGQANASDG